jgi:hypothetical protein
MRGWFSPIDVELLAADDLEQLLVSLGVPVDQRRELALLYQIAPEIAAREVNHRLPGSNKQSNL